MGGHAMREYRIAFLKFFVAFSNDTALPVHAKHHARFARLPQHAPDALHSPSRRKN